MVEIKEEQERRTRAVLVGAPDDNLSELKGLVDTLGMECAKALTLTRLEVQPAYGMGKGKAAEIANLAKEIQSDCIIFDFQIDPTKQRNWEKLAGIPVFDREEVILRIFARRAQTHEAVLQVELARLQYSLPRLAHSYGDMARQRGGSHGTKGSGETQLELDQRQVRERIYQTKQELKTVASGRETQRKRRDRIRVPSCALVGYTNAGKSSLLNALTGADVFVENKLFATLDPTTRRLSLKDGGSILLTDTVGFISNLPHTLVDAFKSTLEEAVQADLQLLVIDAADSDAENQYKTVCSVLDEIGAGKKPRLILLNKTDKLDSDGLHLAQLKITFPDALYVSAKEKTGFTELAVRMSTMLLGEKRDYVLPVSEKALLDEIRRSGLILDEKWMDDGIHVTARAAGRPLALITPYLVQ
ncbi:MAG: GTPase HflX [Treponema sp.]